MNVRGLRVVDFFTFESLTVGATSVGLTASTYAPTTGPEAQYAYITVEGDDIRYRMDGGDATATSHLYDFISAGAETLPPIEIYGAVSIRNFRAIRVTGNATLRVSYAR